MKPRSYQEDPMAYKIPNSSAFPVARSQHGVIYDWYKLIFIWFLWAFPEIKYQL